MYIIKKKSIFVMNVRFFFIFLSEATNEIYYFHLLHLMKLMSYSFQKFEYHQSMAIIILSSLGPLFSYSTQLSMKFILLINVIMPTIVDILTFISMINTTLERLKARNFFICWYFSFYEQLKFHAHLS